jgi:hypothetical protein
MKYLSLIILSVFFVACKQNRLDVDVSSIDVTLDVQRFDELFFKTDTNELYSVISDAYAENRDFIDLYTQRIIRIGGVESENFKPYLQQFVGDTVMVTVADSVVSTFGDFSVVYDDLIQGFKHYSYYFPTKPVPQIYTCISGFNQSLVFGENFIAIGLEKYLGNDCPFYHYLGIPKYKIANMRPDKIVTDLFYGWALTEYLYNDSIDNLLSNMIYQGKLLYFSEAMNPDFPDSLIIGYRSDQLDWCKQNEAMMWSFLVDKRLLYNSERLTLQKYIGDAPFTNSFSAESPGRTGSWLGWQIVRSYMENNSEITLEELMNRNDAQQLLNQSNYFPN